MNNGYHANRDRSWVPEAKQLLEQNHTYLEVARRVGRSRDTVRTVLPGYGKRNPKWHAQALEMLKDGRSYRDVSRTVGIDNHQIAKVFPGYGFTVEETQMVRQANAMLKKLGA